MLTGVILRLIAVFLITTLSAVVHTIGDRAALGQLISLRSGLSLIPILAYLAIRGQLHTLRTKHPGMHLVRGLMGAAAMTCSFISLMYLPIANATALGFLGPVLSLPLAAIFLKETIAPKAVIAVLIGFAGMLLMVADAIKAPESGQLAGTLAGLGFALCIAMSRIQIRAMTAHESAGAIVFSFSVVAALVGLVITPPWLWPPLTLEVWGLIALCGLIGGLGHIATTEATARASISALAAFEFTGLIWAAGYDFLLDAAVPSSLQVLGMLTIVCASLTVLGRPKRKPAPKA